jgi:AAA+ superfamily predicted ATPase
MTKPEWVTELARRYFTRNVSQFILHGNIQDYVQTEDAQGQQQYAKFKDFLIHSVFKKRDIILTYDRAMGLNLIGPDANRDFKQVFLPNYDALNGTRFSQSFPNDPLSVFAVLEKYILTRLNQGQRVALIIDFADTLVPNGEMSSLSAVDRGMLVFLQRWSKESLFLEKDMTTILLVENLTELHRSLSRNPHIADIAIPYPNLDERQQYITHYMGLHPDVQTKLEMQPLVLGQYTAGLNLVQVHTLLAEVHNQTQVLTHEQLTQRKKELIENEAGGLLAFVESKLTLDTVAGHIAAKAHLRAAAQALRQGRTDVMPMGYLINGPVGTGKTFLVQCFAGEIGIPMVVLKNFRSQWQGATEANLEKILSLLKAMTPVAVMIDEADAYLGDRDNSGDSGVSNRVFSMIASFMSNTDHRGKIIWFLLTARPDLMPVDLKRQGRAEEHLALFYPETLADKRELMSVMLKRTGISNLTAEDFDEAFYEEMQVRSGADMEAALTRVKFKAVSGGLTDITPELIASTFADFIPPTYPEEIELMNLVAVLECTSQALLPERYKNVPRSELVARLRALQAMLG